jgi:F-type H+-transporting ATPase subunit epsilon
MHLEIITPESKVYSGEATAVQLPGLDGSFQVLNNHAPVISALTAGKVKIDLVNAFEREEKTSELIQQDKGNSKVIYVDIKGGVIEMLNNKIIVLAE